MAVAIQTVERAGSFYGPPGGDRRGRIGGERRMGRVHHDEIEGGREVGHRRIGEGLQRPLLPADRDAGVQFLEPLPRRDHRREGLACGASTPSSVSGAELHIC